MAAPTLKTTRTGSQRYETTFRIDLDEQSRSPGQSVSFPSLGEHGTTDWNLYWFVAADGLLWAGVGWNGMAVGTVKGWTSWTIRVHCSTLGVALDDVHPAADKKEQLPPNSPGLGWYLGAYQGKGHGLRDIVVTFEIVHPPLEGSKPTSITAGYTDVNFNPIINNVQFFFAQNLTLYGNVDSLSKSSPHYKRLFESGFAESAPSMPGPDPAKPNRRKVERDFEDSDDETDAHTVARRTTNDSDGATAIPELPFRHVHIDHSAFTTYRAVLCYLQTGHIVFAPLHSSFRLKPDSDTLRTAEIKKLTTDPAHPLAASPKSVYRLAHFLELTPLAELALANLKSQLTKENIAFEVFGDVAAVYEEVNKVTMELALKEWDYVVTSAAMKAVEKIVEEGGMSSYSIQSLKLMRKMAPRAAAT